MNKPDESAWLNFPLGKAVLEEHRALHVRYLGVVFLSQIVLSLQIILQRKIIDQFSFFCLILLVLYFLGNARLAGLIVIKAHKKILS